MTPGEVRFFDVLRAAVSLVLVGSVVNLWGSGGGTAVAVVVSVAAVLLLGGMWAERLSPRGRRRRRIR